MTKYFTKINMKTKNVKLKLVQNINKTIMK